MKVLHAEGGLPGAAASCLRFMEKMETKYPDLFRQMPRVRLVKDVPDRKPYKAKGYTGLDPVARVAKEDAVIKDWETHGSLALTAKATITSESAVAHILHRRGIRVRVPRGTYK